MKWTGYVEYGTNGFTMLLDINNHYIENYVVDDEYEVKFFKKISERRYELKILKKYYDFNTLESRHIEFDVVYELVNW